MLSFFGMDFALKFGREDQENKKRSLSQNLKLLNHVHSICVAVSQKKSGCGDLFWGKSSLVLLCEHEVYSRSGGTSSDLGVAKAMIWGGTARNAPPSLYRRSQDF